MNYVPSRSRRGGVPERRADFVAALGESLTAAQVVRVAATLSSGRWLSDWNTTQ